MREEIINLRPADFETEKCVLIKEWKTSFDSFCKDAPVNRSYLVAAACICELCVKDVIEQTYKLLLFLKDEYEESYFIGLLKRHNVESLILELRDSSEGDYSFPPIPGQINSKEIMSILYEPIDINISKEDIEQTVNIYMRYHGEFLDDYDQRRYKLKLSLSD